MEGILVESNITLNYASNTVAIPSMSQAKSNLNLISKGTEEALKGEYVKSVLIPESFNIILPNYVIDFTKITKVYQHQLQSLSSILVEDGDTAIYIYMKDGLKKLGMGSGERLDRMLVAGITSIFNNQCKVFRDVDRGKKLIEVTLNDISGARLNI